jgi:hypothetical protein
MRYLGPRAGSNVDWTGSEYKGPTTIVRAAKDPVRVPEEPSIVALLQRCLCTARVGEDCYVVKGMTGDERTVPYGGSQKEWDDVCNELLELALSMDGLE